MALVTDVAKMVRRDVANPRRVWLGNLPERITEFAVLQLVKQCGPLADFDFPVHCLGPRQGATVGYCFVTFTNQEDAAKAVKGLDGLTVQGRRLNVKPAKPTRAEIHSAVKDSAEIARLRIVDEINRKTSGLTKKGGLMLVGSKAANSKKQKKRKKKEANATPSFADHPFIFERHPALGIPDLCTVGMGMNFATAITKPIGPDQAPIRLTPDEEREHKAIQIRRIESALRLLDRRMGHSSRSSHDDDRREGTMDAKRPRMT